MRISVSITNYSWPAGLAAELARVARAADDAGLDTLWVADHLIQADPSSVPEAEMLEAYAPSGSSPPTRGGSASARWSPRSPSARRAC